MPSATIRLIAETVEHFDEDSVYSLGLVEETADVEERLALIFSAPEQDHENSGYSVVTEPGQRTVYRAIASCELEERVLRIQFTEGAAVELGLPIELSLDLAVDSRQLATLERGLVRIGVPVVRPS